MPNISRQQLVKLLSTQAATIVSLYTETSVKMNKTVNGLPNPYCDRVTKQCKVNGVINFDYTNAVNNRRDKEGHPDVFVAKERKWGQRIAGTPLVENKGKFYLEISVQRCLEHRLMLDGKIAPDDVKDYMKERGPEGERQELDKPLVLRDYSLDSILAIQMNGQLYSVL